MPTTVVVVVVVRVVGKAGVLFLWVVEHHAKSHPFPSRFAVGQRPHACKDRSDTRIGIGHQFTAGIAADRPNAPAIHSRSEIKQVCGGSQVFATAITVAVRTFITHGVICPRSIPCTRAVTVEVLAPKQKLNRVVTRGDVGLDAVGFLQGVFQQRRRDGCRVDVLTRQRERSGWR